MDALKNDQEDPEHTLSNCRWIAEQTMRSRLIRHVAYRTGPMGLGGQKMGMGLDWLELVDGGGC